VSGPRTAPAPRAGLRHDALLFDDEQSFVSQALAHLREGAAAGEQLVVACTEPRRRLLLTALDGSLDVTVLGNGDTYQRAVATTQVYVGLTHRAMRAGATGLRVVGELPADTSRYPRLWPQWSRYEAVVDQALGALPFHALCAYDVRRTPPSLLEAVRRTHRRLGENSAARRNDDYTEPAESLAAWADPDLLPVESSPPLLEMRGLTRPGHAREARARLEQLLAGIDTVLVPYADYLPPPDPTLVEADEYVLAVGEVLMNALTHGGGQATLRVWALHDQVVTTVTDPGPGFDDPFAGYVPPDEPTATSEGLRPRPLGLWLARQMCDELSFRHDEEGFTVRLRADLDVRAP
jgi:anti-sigma regulatory factor (Ser/Thr protein kinase)